jgi:homoserine kinase type II
MAVLTSIDEADAVSLLSAYGLGPLRVLAGVPAGSVNSNFALEVEGTGRLFLRLYEERDRVGAAREAALLERLALAGVPTPAPLRRTDGQLVSAVRGKAAALFPWREGGMRCQASVTPHDARLVGQALARVHAAGATEELEEGRFRFEDLLQRLDRIERSRDAQLVARVPALRGALRSIHAARDRSLPRGLTHGDLFRDNVLWDAAGDVSALLDFESACADSLAYDLMVTVLSWCVGDELDAGLARAMREGYESIRPLDDAEKRGLHAEASFGALRFTITRITDYALRADAAGPRVVKDWRRFMMRFDRLQALGREGLAAALGL